MHAELDVTDHSPILALDIGGTKIACAIVIPGENPHIVLEKSVETQAMRGGERVLENVVALVDSVASEYAGMPHARPMGGIAVASAGVIDEDKGEIASATDLMPGWAGQQVGTELEKRFGLPVSVINDVHAHALGEATWGAGRHAHSLVVIAVGTGIGGAYVLNGKVVHGEHNVAGHFGHVPHPLADGVRCSCGRTGHIESVASGVGVTYLYNARLRAERASIVGMDRLTFATNGKDVQRLMQEGDRIAREAMEDSAKALGNILGAICNALDPTCVVISGSMTRAGERWWEKIREGYAESAMDPVAQTTVVEGALGGHAPLLGAVAHHHHCVCRDQCRLR